MKNRKGIGLISLGLLLIAAALFLTGYNWYEEYQAERAAIQALENLAEYFPEENGSEEASTADEFLPEAELPDYVRNPDMEMPVRTVDGVDYVGILQIPALELELPVISEWSYPGLRVAPCRYSGSAYSGGLVIAGHNYASHFGKLKQLREGDSVLFTDMEGHVFSFETVLCEVLQPTDVEEMTDEGWDLTLFTCTVSGKSRVTIRCTAADF